MFHPEFNPYTQQVDTRPITEMWNVHKLNTSTAGDFQALKRTNLNIHPGEFVSIIGESGRCKSTLLNMITGIDRPGPGKGLVNGTPVNGLNENQLAGWRGGNPWIIIQFFQFPPVPSIKQNVILPMALAGKSRPREKRERAGHLLEIVDLARHMRKFPSMVSGNGKERQWHAA